MNDEYGTPSRVNAGSEYAWLSAGALRSLYRTREVSPVEVTQALLDRAEDLNPLLGMFVTISPDKALEQARVAESLFCRAPEMTGPLVGVPITLKDLTATAGVRTTMGSLLFEDWIPDFDSPVAQRLANAGAVMLGKTTTPEFGWKGDSGNRVNGPACNPWDKKKTAGGSSGGAAAAVAAGLGPIAQGTDGAGSIRIPASFCGVFGIKPSFGLVPSFPPPASGMGHLGPITRTVLDAALFLDATAGPDPRDRFSLNAEHPPFENVLHEDIRGLRIGWTPNLGFANVDGEVATLAEAAVGAFSDMGCDVVTIETRLNDPYESVEIIWTTAQAAIHRTDFAQIGDKLDQGRLAIIERGLSFSGQALAGARLDSDAFAESMLSVMSGIDVLALPTVPVTAFAAGADHPTRINGLTQSALSWLQLLYPFNITTQPAASVPAGFTNEGMPVGLQLVGRWRDDRTVLRAAAHYERARPWGQPPEI